MSYAPEWDAEHAKRDMLCESPLRIVEEWFSRWVNKPAPMVLDIGCGAGTNTLWLARIGFQVCAFDASRAAIVRLKAKLASARTAYNPRLVIADATAHWPYFSGRFDAAVDVRVLENLTENEVRFAYKEVARVLKPGAPFFSLTASESRDDKYTTVGVMRKSTRAQVEEYYAEAGLELVNIKRMPRTGLEDWAIEAKAKR